MGYCLFNLCEEKARAFESGDRRWNTWSTNVSVDYERVLLEIEEACGFFGSSVLKGYLSYYNLEIHDSSVLLVGGRLFSIT